MFPGFIAIYGMVFPHLLETVPLLGSGCGLQPVSLVDYAREVALHVQGKVAVSQQGHHGNQLGYSKWHATTCK